ncbi:MAG: hypothetical protein RIQ89_2121 [Bacteroidota bacterium]|jgi:antitoxin component YwqK of YwqJK toxin-antitoxin module
MDTLFSSIIGKPLWIIALFTAVMVNDVHGQNKNYYDTIYVADEIDKLKVLMIVIGPKGFTHAQGYLVNGEKDGVWKDYNDVTGVINKLEEYKLGKLDGSLITFYGNGMVASDELYANDMLHGLKLQYSNYGRLKSSESYKNGTLNGKKIAYYDSGKIQESSEWLAGKRHGITNWYGEGAKIIATFNYEYGLMDGEYKKFDTDGKLILLGGYKKSNEDGEWIYYTNGIATKKELYKDGKLIKEVSLTK